MDTPAPTPKVYTAKQLQAMGFPYSLNHIYVMARANKLPTVRVGRKLLFPAHAIEELLRQVRGAA